MGQSRLRFGIPTTVITATLSIGVLTSSAGAVHEGNYPGHIHAGSCQDLGEVVFPLANASVGGMMAGMTGTPVAEMEMGTEMGSAGRVPVATSFTVVDASLEDILAEEHAINFHESEENIQNYVACGDVGGAVMGDPGDGGRLVVGLRSLNASGISGVATLTGMGDETEVAVFLAEDLTGVDAADGADATPIAGSPVAGDEVAVDIVDYAYDPDPITIPVGGTVTWTNQDGVPHTATGRDREALQSGGIAGGDAYSETFDEAGTYEYFCEFHANMEGTVVVE